MKIAHVQDLLMNFSKWHETAGGKQIASELERFSRGLDAHRDLSISEFCEILQRSSAECNGNNGASKSTKAKPKPDQEKIQIAVHDLQILLDRSTHPDLTYEVIDAEIDRLDGLLSKDEGMEVAKELGISTSGKSKIAVLQEVGRRASARKSLHERGQRLELSATES